MEIRASLLKYLSTVALAGAMSFTIGAAGASAGTTTHPNALTLNDQVRHELVTLPWYGVFDNLEYQLNGTEVTLSGQVTSEHAVTKDDAERFVKSIPGVTKVVNNIEVLPLSPNDDQIRRATWQAIYRDPVLSTRYGFQALPSIHIIVKNGHVRLEGVVANEGDKNIAGIRANGVQGAFSVENDLRVEGR